MTASHQVTHQTAKALLDTDPEDAFDKFTVLASRLMGVPVSTVSIIDYDGRRQFFKSQRGLDAPWSETRQTPLSKSFCRLVAENNLPLAWRMVGMGLSGGVMLLSLGGGTAGGLIM